MPHKKRYKNITGSSKTASGLKFKPGRFTRVIALMATLLAGSTTALASDLVITGVVDGPLTGGTPKAIELCVLNNIPDLSDYGIGSANNGLGSDGEEFTFPAGAVSAGTFLYVASESSGFSTFFGLAPNYTTGAAAINGDDAIELFMSGSVVDIFGDINLDGSGQPWDHVDGWAYRNDTTGPDGSTFVLANWFFSGINALVGETSNGTAATPFPIGGYSACEAAVAAPDLLISEIAVTPTSGEFIEIYNPTAAAVDLSDVYLTDATFSGSGTYYYNIVTGAGAGGGGFGDFHARFPDGATIAAGEYQTVSIAEANEFFLAYGSNPTYELFEDGVGVDGNADMREALPGSINGQGGLTNGGELVVLYTWDGESDLVQDIDYAVWGDKDEAVDKTGVAIDGPDADATASSYLADTAIAAQDLISAGAHAVVDSFQRVDFTEGVESQSGGNGVTGSNETSEDLSITWSQAAPTPGASPAAPPASWVINEIHADPEGSVAGDANGDGVRHASADEFVELVNISGGAVDISGWTLADSFSVRHTFPGGTVIPDQCGIVVFGGGSPTGSFGNMTVQTASSGSLSLNNSGDNITLNNGSSDVATAGYGSEGSDNQSLTRDPDISGGAYVKHSVAAGSAGALYSPGTRINGADMGGCPSPWVINEIHADPDAAIAGDANGDGTRSSSGDEFVEIVNNTGADFDISGWTLADGFSVRHIFPAGSTVYQGCSVVVFGGGAPTGTFGSSLVQTASSGSLGLNNGGDSVTLNDGFSDISVANYGSEGGDDQSLTLDPDVFGALPYVKHSGATGSGGTLFSPGSKINSTQFDGCPVGAEIHEIQGAGASSPLEGKLVQTDADVVTTLAPDGFFMQTPDTLADADPDTSEGIFVYTGTAPAVAVGDLVDVFGTIEEFFGFTEITSTTFSIVGTGVLPTPISLGGGLTCSVSFECYEGMLVEVANGTVTGPNQRFNPDPLAEVHITAAPVRTFREPGIEFPGLPGLPVWDGNPEVFELDPDRLGLTNQIIPAGSSFSAAGVIGFEFGGYELWPSQLTVTPASLPVPVRNPTQEEMTIGALNLFRLFDDVDNAPTSIPNGNTADDFVVSTAEYARRLTKFSAYIRSVLKAPDVLAVSEAESLAVLQDLADEINFDNPALSYTPYLEEGNDIGSIDVGFLVRDTVAVDAVTQLGRLEIHSFDGTLLHDRPPLLLEGRQIANGSDFPFAVMAIHGRSLSGIDSTRVRQKRLEQAESVAAKVQALQLANPDINLVVTGDFNAFEFTDGYVDVTGHMKGSFTAADNLVCATNPCPDVVNPDLINQVLTIPASERYSFIFRGNAQTLDHALTSSGLDELITDFNFGRGNADAAVDLINDANTVLRSSDHDGLVLFLNKDSDGDGVLDDADMCMGTVIPEGAAWKELKEEHWALYDADRIFDTIEKSGKSKKSTKSKKSKKSKKGGGSDLPYDIFDTAGCSCEQIIEEKHRDHGHSADDILKKIKYGCSNGEMKKWIKDLGKP